MRKHFPTSWCLTAAVLIIAGSAIVVAGERVGDGKSTSQPARVVRIGAVAYAPSAVTIFENIRRYFDRRGMPVDYVLFSHYDALVEALRKGEVDIAWNTPLAHAQYHRKAGNASQALVMRDVDCNVRSVLVVRTDASIRTPADLAGKTLVLGSRQAAEATVLPVHFLRREGVNFDHIKIHSLDGNVDLRGNPCSSEVHVLAALNEGIGHAGIIGERYWKHLTEHEPDRVSGLKAIWISPPFSHCVFTASKDFDKELAARFTRLMLAMDPSDPLAAEAMRLEGTRRWVAGSQDGFRELLKALDESPACCSSACGETGTR
jgi:phosphonate transport system substrate-binding protein